ncbi:ash family protein [Candidatus Symbiopectobacterium sp. NZEC151]|nr:ash family protein [Candidatus Symbiopectobacterium sp. NZEC151]
MPLTADGGIVNVHLQNQVPGLEPCRTSLTTPSAFALFLCRALSCTSMVGRAGASQDAPVSVRPVVPTPSGSTTQEIGTSGGG